MSDGRDAVVHLDDMLDNMVLARRFVERISTVEELENDEKTLYALIRALEVVGEAAKRVPDDVRALAPEVPWREMAGMRDKLIHGYDAVDLELVFLTVTQRIPTVEPAVRALRDRLESAAR